METPAEVSVSLASVEIAPVLQISIGTKKTLDAATTGLELKEITLTTGLSDAQKKLAEVIYSAAKQSIEQIVSKPGVASSLKVTMTIATIIKLLENVKIEGHPPTGSDKKAVAIELGRRLIQELVKDETEKTEILALYDLLAESTLETMIDVSKAVNTVVQEVATKCCVGFFASLKK